MAKAKVVKEKSLEDILFDCRNSLRGRAPMTDKRDLLLTLVFLKFIDYRFVKQQEKIREKYKSRGDEGYTEFALSRPSEYAQDGVFFLSDDIRWENLKTNNPNTMAIEFDNAIKKLEDIEVGTREGRPVRPLRNALPQQIFTKTNLEPGVIKEVVNNIDMIDPDKFGQTDLIGRVYEYFLQAFSINADKEEGEFYTPHSIVELIATLVEPYDGTLYDPCCGSGGMFVQSMKLLEAHGGNTKAVNVYGQESEPATYRLAKMNLAVRGISYDLGEKAISTFSNDQHKDKKYDYIMANPPFNLKPWWTIDDALEDDPRWKGYPAPPLSNANYAWILHMLSKLDPSHGVAGFLLSNGALDDQDALAVRKKLLENDKIEAIIVLPREMFYSTDISVTLWILNNNKKGGEHHGRKLRNREKEVLFVDLRTWNGNIYEKKYVKFTEEQIKAIQKIYLDWQTIVSDEYAQPELYYSAKLNEIASKNYSLVPSKYIEFIDHDREIDYATVIKGSATSLQELISRQEHNSKVMKDSFDKALNSQVSHINIIRLGEYIEVVDKRNDEMQYSVDDLRGVTSESIFDYSKAKTDGIDFSKYKIVSVGEFAYNPSRINLGSIAYNTERDYILSPMYLVFRVKQQYLNIIDPRFLFMWFLRPEFLRSTLFYASGSVRDTFGIPQLNDVYIPLPSLPIQEVLANAWESLRNIKKLAAISEELTDILCPAMLQKFTRN